MKFMTFAEFAKHRGVSRAAVSKAVNDGRLTVISKNGKKGLSSKVADAEWDARATGGSTLRRQIDAQTLRIERARAEKMELELKLLKGDLVRVEEILPEYEKQNTILRQHYFALGHRVAQQLARETDPNVIKTTIDNEVNQILADMQDALKDQIERLEKDTEKKRSRTNLGKEIEEDASAVETENI